MLSRKFCKSNSELNAYFSRISFAPSDVTLVEDKLSFTRFLKFLEHANDLIRPSSTHSLCERSSSLTKLFISLSESRKILKAYFKAGIFILFLI